MASPGTERWLVAILVSLLLGAAHGQSPLRPLPPVLRMVSDEVGVLSQEEGERLAVALQEILEKTGVRMILVIARTTRPEPIEDYAERLARRWLAERGVDPERIIMTIVAMEEREMLILPGRALGLEDALQRQDPRHPPLGALFKEQRYFEGLMLLAARIRALIERNPPAPPAAEKERR